MKAAHGIQAVSLIKYSLHQLKNFSELPIQHEAVSLWRGWREGVVRAIIVPLTATLGLV